MTIKELKEILEVLEHIENKDARVEIAILNVKRKLAYYRTLKGQLREQADDYRLGHF